MLQPQSDYIFRPAGSVAGCPGMRSLLYNWSGAAPGTNLIEVVYTGQGTVLGDSRIVIVPPPLIISGLNPGAEQVIWSSTPGVNYIVLSTTNLSQPFTPASVRNHRQWPLHLIFGRLQFASGTPEILRN